MNNEKHYNFSPAAGLISSQQRPNWVVDNLIEKGEQWIINGSPKTGKSLLATQLGLAVASGSVFLNWEIKRPALVLYMDFEVNDRLFWQRYYTMSAQTNLGDAKNIKTFLRCGDYKSTDVLDPMASQAIIDIVNDIQPDLIIWDVLARMHNAEENNNGEMGQVMRAIRKISGAAAHIIVHHARKVSPNAGGVNAGVMSMRGASSIHGEADGVISLGTREGQGARYSLTFSARAVETRIQLRSAIPD
ncbi:AAA family ATPase [Aeromonas media]|uniref:AAA family ATPase n=1 Tax=Aeromonas media TaxID=651 RepID=UPI0038D07504